MEIDRYGKNLLRMFASIRGKGSVSCITVRALGLQLF